MRPLYFERFYRPKRRFKRGAIIAGLVAVALLVLFLIGYSRSFGPVMEYAPTEEFIVNPDDTVSDVAAELKHLNFIRSEWAFKLAYVRAGHGSDITEGGYTISRGTDAWTIASAFSRPPYLAWVSVRPGLRKEEVAELLVKKLGWTEEQKQEWLDADTAGSLPEGVFYGDTYLIPSDQSPAQVAARMRARFEEAFAPYAQEAAEKGLSWNEVITMASLVEREAAKNDKPLVAGILWNRIDIGMALQVDAGFQYIRGEEGNWWPAPRSEDKEIDSPFNTYMYPGLPPHPIASPSLSSIIAVVEPDATDCIFYLHDSDGQIHCSETYAGQRANVERYLR
ncbi:MAG TPA: endolytic transglycosylase MltG [Candidatus Paceibacterota bacterium]|nr:endolytic transglycosylase MltG [Candidatus Paceibacterota bacterium]